MNMVVLQITNKAGAKGFIPLTAVQLVFELPDSGCVLSFTDSTEMVVLESLNDLLRQIPDPHP